MKSLIGATLLGACLAQWLPSCSWNDCMGNWDGWNCDQRTGVDCICSNGTALTQINACVSTSCTNTTDQQEIYGGIAQLCADHGKTVTNTEEATFSATSGGSLYPTITGGPGGWGPGGHWNSESWSSFVSLCSSAVGGPPSGWTSGGPWGGGWRNHGGPWGSEGPRASGVPCDGPWTTWTAGWGPHSSWTGFWSGCSTITASPEAATVTTTINGTVVTGTTFGIQAAAQSTTGSGNINAAASIFSTPTVLGISGSFVGAVFALMIVL